MKIRQTLLLACAAGAMSAWAQADPAAPPPAPAPASEARQCSQLADKDQRLACYDRLLGGPATPVVPVAEAPAAPPAEASDCRSGSYSMLSRFWELEHGTDCGRFGIRGYRPLSLSWVHADTVNMAPSSPTPDHTALTDTPYLPNEQRIQLSVRTKIAQGLLPQAATGGHDSLWFAYTQQSYWQLFASSISRPFRNTDHEPEFIYILPTQAELGGGWQLRYTGLAINHQSNGQSLPLSRSWNRAILMAGMEKGDRYTVQARLWNRITDGDGMDDNPEIDTLIGRGELTATWRTDADQIWMLTLRHSLSRPANGSWRLEWFQPLSNPQRGPYANGLNLHVQIFSGYGDSLVDYNRWRSLLSIGLALVDW